MNTGDPVSEPFPVVLVTAAASGIGRSIAEAFLDEGARVHVCDVDSDALATFLADHPEATGEVADVSQDHQVNQVVATVEKQYGRLDTLINNAGIAGPTASVEDIDTEQWKRTLAVNLDGPFFATRQAVPLIRRSGGGSIINIASNAGLLGCPQRSAYVAGKWAMVGLTKTWAMELGPCGIRVNALCPCSVNGDRINAVIERDAEHRGLTSRDVREAYQRQSSLRQFVDAQDIANMALFLSSARGAKISGQAIAIDGHTETLANYFN